MSNVMRLSPCIAPLQTTRPMSLNNAMTVKVNCSSSPNFMRLIDEDNTITSIKAKAVASYYSEQGSLVDDLPVSVQLEPISSETHFHQVVDEAQKLQQSIVIVWIASWCRKCIYLKPKLEKLSANYYPSIRFFCVDVNNVSHKLVGGAEITKIPTIQLWHDGKKQAEVIGSHKAYLVVNEVREMIENKDSLL